MNDPTHLDIVVGVDGSQTGWAALEWAADEAERRGCALTVVHAGDVDPVFTETRNKSVGAGSTAYGPQLLADCLAALADSHPKVDVHTRLIDERPGPALLELSAQATLTVIGRGRDNRLTGWLFGSTAHQLAAHAHSPTVVVGPEADRRPNRIVVGVSPSAGGLAAMRFAAEEATMRGVELVAVRARDEFDWPAQAEQATAAELCELRRIEQHKLLNSWLAQLAEQYPNLKVRGELLPTPADLALSELAAHAGLLVVGCRHSDDARQPRIGPMSSWLMYHTACPIAIVGHPSDNAPTRKEAD